MKKKGSNINYYINNYEYINKTNYNIFLKNIYNNLLFDNNIFDIPIFKNNNMCNCNVNSLTNIKFLTSASNDIYIAQIKKNVLVIQHILIIILNMLFLNYVMVLMMMMNLNVYIRMN